MILENVAFWERAWAPYDEATYQAVLTRVRPSDVVLDIGAGDFRLAQRIAPYARFVYGVEQNRRLFPKRAGLPANLALLWADARNIPFPPVTVGVLLMRHCRHFWLYAQKLRDSGCRRLFTNARWGMGVEEIDLEADRLPFTAVSMGWYACNCGAVGFLPGPAELLTPELEKTIHEVTNCPNCKKG